MKKKMRTTIIKDQKRTVIKRGIVIAILILSTISLNAQIKYGVQLHGMLNTASFNSEADPSPKSDFKFGFGGGIYAEYPLSNMFSIKSSINYIRKGSKRTETYIIGEGGSTATQKANINLNYIEVPMVLTYNLGNASNKWFVGVGPSFGYGFSGEAKIFQTVRIGSQTNTQYIESNAFKDAEDYDLGLKRFDFSLNGVVGMHIFDKGTIQVGYLHGLTNIANKKYFEHNKYRNRGIMLTLGYRFN